MKISKILLISLAAFQFSGCFFDDQSNDSKVDCTKNTTQRIKDSDEHSGLWSGAAIATTDLTKFSDSAIIGKFLIANKIQNSLRSMVKLGTDLNGKYGIAGLSILLDSSQGQDSMVIIPELKNTSLRYLSIEGGLFRFMSNDKYLPAKLIELTVSGNWEELPEGPFQLQQLESYQVGPAHIIEAENIVVLSRNSTCLTGLNLSNNRLTKLPNNIENWDYNKRALSLSGNMICNLTHNDSILINTAQADNQLSQFWTQNCP